MHLLWIVLSLLGPENEKVGSGEYIMRLHDECELVVTTPQRAPGVPYPWQQEGVFQGITKEHFRCKGSSRNEPHIILKDGKEFTRYYDCSGSERHSLPLLDGQEHIYPVLIDLLNHVQKKSGKSVIVTSGHRCLTHQTFIDPSPKASSSKHMIGAEVDFYVQGMEHEPEKVVKIVMDYYKGQPKEYETFQRFEKTTDVSTQPWMNKEIFIKIYRGSEGRSSDNQHIYPFVSIQVRFSRESNQKVVFSPEQAQKLLRK